MRSSAAWWTLDGGSAGKKTWGAREPRMSAVIPWILLDRAPLPNSNEEIRLYQRGDEFAIRVANYELMNSRVHGSEEALADLAFAKLGGRSPLRVLIGGLGLGYTLAAALRGVGAR